MRERTSRLHVTLAALVVALGLAACSGEARTDADSSGDLSAAGAAEQQAATPEGGGSRWRACGRRPAA